MKKAIIKRIPKRLKKRVKKKYTIITGIKKSIIVEIDNEGCLIMPKNEIIK